MTVTTTPTEVRPLLRGWLHFGGVVVLLACSPVLYLRARTGAQDGWISCYVVGVGLMMATSATLHRGRWSPVGKKRMQRADLVGIFLAIAGSFLAISGLTLHGEFLWSVPIVIVAGTVLGLSVRRLAITVSRWPVALTYLVIGWAPTALALQIYRGGGALCVTLVAAGGLAYSIGAVIFSTRRPALSPRVFGYHELFHACTIVGATCHFAAVAAALH
jgi:hemolysin III